jgi:hypothetical protein
MFAKKTTYTDDDNFLATVHSFKDKLPVWRGCIQSRLQINENCLHVDLNSNCVRCLISHIEKIYYALSRPLIASKADGPPQGKGAAA